MNLNKSRTSKNIVVVSLAFVSLFVISILEVKVLNDLQQDLSRKDGQISTLEETVSKLKQAVHELKSQNNKLVIELDELNRNLSLLQIVGNEYIRTEWADTLDLEDYARLGLNYIDGSMDYFGDDLRNIYFSTGLLTDPPKMWMKREIYQLFGQNAILLGIMTGGERGREIEDILKRDLIECMSIGGPGLGFYNFEPFLVWYQIADERTRNVIRQSLDRSIESGWQSMSISEEGEYAHMPPLGGGSEISAENKPAYLEDWANRNGYIIGQLVRWYDLTGSESALKLSKYMANWIVYHTDLVQADGSFTLAGSEVDAGEVGCECSGHVESRLRTAAGIIRCGIATNNREFIEWGKKVVDYVDRISRGNGSNSFGWFYENVMVRGGCETCCITRMIDCAILLTRAGYPQYWNLVERAARNHLIESQLRDVSWVNWTRSMEDTADESYYNVAERAKGGWAGWSDPNDWVGRRVSSEGASQIMACCVTGGEGLYLVWSNIVTKDDDGVWVNLALNRATKWVDVNSHSPYEGKLEITVKDAPTLFIRVPDWVDKGSVEVKVDDDVQQISWRGDYIQLEGLKKGQNVTVTYPLREITETIVLIPEKGTALDADAYTITWKGDTIIGISPKGRYYPLYEREFYRSDKAPMRRIIYNCPVNEIHW